MDKFYVAICLSLLLALCGCRNAEPETEATDLRASPFEQGEITALETRVSNRSLQELLPEECPLEVAWTVPGFQSPGSKLWLPPQELGLNMVLVLTEANDLLAFRRSDGNPMWWTKLGENPPLGDPVFTEFSIYLLLEGNLLNLERQSGDVIWQLRLGFPPSPFMAISEPEMGNPTIYIASLTRVV
ncbi:MAG: hypothetical protein JXA52_06785, partial [Planctomycetes bacterium]|nr:hypothetical protein [Planctomycetota bacterium]